MHLNRLLVVGMAKRCFLRCSKGSHPDLPLPDGGRVVVGRGPATRIKDKRCSREQLALTAKYDARSVDVEQLGSNASSVAGTALSKGQRATLSHGGLVEIVAGDIAHSVHFDPPPLRESHKLEKADETREETTPRKRKPKEEPEPGPAGNKRTNIIGGRLQFELMREAGRFRWEKSANDEVFVMTTADSAPRSKIASFDMDGTLITTSSGRVFAKDRDDWKMAFAEVPGQLKDLANKEGYKVVVFTNQGGIRTGKVKVADYVHKIEAIAAKLGSSVPLQLFAAAGEGAFRKPRVGLWNLLAEKFNGSVDIDLDASFYCGDAAGRRVAWLPGKKKDFSCSDRLFAMNLGLQFRTPEEQFLGQKATSKFDLPEFDPKSVDRDTPILETKGARLIGDAPEVVLLVGIQGSGKSHFAEKHFESAGYVVASNDRCGGSRDKAIRVMQAALREGRSVVVDNTHADADARKKFVDAAKLCPRLKAVRCFVMAASVAQARHNNLFRELTGSAGKHAKISAPIFHSYKAKYQEPTVAEGFAEVVRVNFVPAFRSEEEEALYAMYLVEK